MTELEAYKAMLQRRGVVFTETTEATRKNPALETSIHVAVSDGQPDGVTAGYSGFYTEHVFDESGQLIRVEAWE